MELKQIKLGDAISLTDIRNTDLSISLLLGVSNEKKIIPSIANTNGTDLSKYKVLKKNQFVYVPTTSRNGDKVSIAILKEADVCIVSSSYTTFEVYNTELIIPDYLMLFFSTSEFDRRGRYNSWGTAREALSWEDLCSMEISVPSIEEQIKIVNQYNAIIKRINILERLNDKLEEFVFLFYDSIFDMNVLECTKKLGEVCNLVLGGTPKTDIADYWDGNIAWINSGEVNNKRIIVPTQRITELGLEKSATKLMPKYTTVVALTGTTCGKQSLLLIDSCGNQSIIGICENEDYPFEFIYPFIKRSMDELLKNKTGGAQEHICKGDFEVLPIFELTEDIKEKYLNIVSPLFKGIEKYSFEIERLKTLKNILISKI